MARYTKLRATMTAAEFRAAALTFPRLSDKAKDVARAILVDGRAAEETAAAFGTSRQLAYQWAKKIYETYRPTGWITETVTLPPELMATVRQMERDAREQLFLSLPEPRVVRD